MSMTQIEDLRRRGNKLNKIRKRYFLKILRLLFRFRNISIIRPPYLYFLCFSFFALLTSAIFFSPVRNALAAVSNTAANVVISILNATSDNLLRNSSFESESSGKPRQWNYQLDSTSGNTFRSAEGIRSGSYGLKFKGEGNGNFGISQPDVKTTPQRTYTFSTYIKVVNASKVTVRIGFWDEYNNKRGTMKDFTFTGTKDWSRINMTATTTGIITDSKNWFSMIEVLGLKSGSIYLDDMKLEEGNVLTAYNTASAKTGHTSGLGDGSILSTVGGDLFPAQSGVGKLGTSDNKWEDLFISDDASIGDSLSVSGNLDVTGNITVAGTQTITGGTTFSGDLAINGGDLTSTATTFNLLNSSVTTLNLAGAATTISLGASTGTTTINNSLTVSGSSVTLPSGSVGVSELADAAKPKTGATQIVCASDAKDTTRCDRVADGTADDVEIQAAIDSLPTAGGSVVLSEGTFNISNTISTGSKNGVTIEGQGADSYDASKLTNLKVANAANLSAVITTQTTGFVRSGIHIRRLKIDGNKSNQTSGDGKGIYLRAYRSSVSEVEIHDCLGVGLHMQGNTSSNLGLENLVSHLRIFRCAIGGILLDNYISDSLFRDVILGKNTTYNLKLGTEASAHLFNQCHFYGDDTTTNNVLFEGGGTRTIFTGCRFEQSVQHSILIDVTSGAIIDVGFTGCRFASNGSGTANTYDDIQVIRSSGTNTAQRFNIVGGHFTRITSSHVNARYGINLVGSYAQDFLIASNNFTAAHYGTSPINDAGTNTMKRNNQGFVTENSGTATISSGSTSVTVSHGLNVTPTADDISVSFAESPTTDQGNWWISSITSTQFTINVRNDPGASNLDLAWRAVAL